MSPHAAPAARTRRTAGTTGGEGAVTRGPHRDSRWSRSRGRTDPDGPWWRRVDWQSSVWTLFLAIPLVIIARSDLPALERLASCGGIIVFAVAYVWTVSTMPTWEDLPPHAHLVHQLRPVAPSLGVMVLVVVATAPVMSWWSAYYLPFFAGIVLFATTLTVGLALVCGACAAVISAACAVSSSPDVRWMAVGCSLSSLSIVAGRVGAEVSARRRIAEKELVAATEREEISRDVHDILGHSLTVLTLKAEVAQRLVRTDPERAEAELAEMVGLSRAALADVRATVTRLRTPDLAGQVEASRTAFAAAEVGLDLAGRASDVPLPQRELLSWALREATTNVLRHAAASHAHVELAPGCLLVVDDGVGTGGRDPGNGLSGLRRRVEAAGGALTVTSPVPAGLLPRSGAKHGTGRPAGPGTMLEVTL